MKQAKLYVQNGVKPIDVSWTDRLVFTFLKEDTQEVWEKWKQYSLG